MALSQSVYNVPRNRGGRAYHRSLSIIPMLFGITSASFCWAALVADKFVPAIITGAFAIAMVMLVRWCWCPTRSLRDTRL